MSELMAHFGRLLDDEALVSTQIALAMKQICDSARIGRAELEQAFTGISYATWRNYMNPRYKSSRSVAVLAAFSWYTGVSMNSFYLGDKLRSFLGVSESGLRLLTAMSQLDGDAFEMACQLAFGMIEPAHRDGIRPAYLKARLLHRERAGRCAFPRPLDIRAFSRDYKRSCALGLIRLQQTSGYSDQRMADLLRVPEARFRKLNNPEDESPIPASVAARFKAGLELEETAFMLGDMRDFPQFARLRRFQDSRDRVMLPLLERLTAEAADRIHRALSALFGRPLSV